MPSRLSFARPTSLSHSQLTLVPLLPLLLPPLSPFWPRPSCRFLKEECLKNDTLAKIMRDDSASREILQVGGVGAWVWVRSLVNRPGFSWCTQDVWVPAGGWVLLLSPWRPGRALNAQPDLPELSRT